MIYIIYIFFQFNILQIILHYLTWNSINQFNPATFMCLSQARTWISKVISHGLFCVQWFEVRGDCGFVDIGGNIYHHCLSSLFIIYIIKQLLTGACIFIFVWFYIVLHFQNVGFYLKVKRRHHAWKLPSGK